jgi:omega-6 fatty acid desaturase (delta-12 desaturase)
MGVNTNPVPDELTIQNLRKTLSHYAKPNLRKAIVQILTTLMPYLGLWGIIIYMVERDYSKMLIAALMLLAALFLVRIFILFHDCVHNSFFRSTRANTIFGYITGILTFTPFRYWQHNHMVHHGSYADLERRGIGDVWILTVNEYLNCSPMKRFGYRCYRNPVVFLGIGPGYVFLLTQRLMHEWEGKKERFSAVVTNLAILTILVVAGLTIGLHIYLLIQIPIFLISGAIGVWLFYVQHQFEGVYWSSHDQWDPVKAALQGSSYYRLPKILQWFSGNIGLHHVHHVLPKIPNYNLQQSCDDVSILQTVPPMNFRKSLKSLFLNLWDEQQQQLISFKALKSRSTPQ